MTLKINYLFLIGKHCVSSETFVINRWIRLPRGVHNGKSSKLPNASNTQASSRLKSLWNGTLKPGSRAAICFSENLTDMGLRKCCCSVSCVYVIGVVGALLVLLGVALVVVVDIFIDSTVKSVRNTSKHNKLHRLIWLGSRGGIL